MCAVLISVVEKLHRPIQLLAITLSLSDANMWHHLANCCLGSILTIHCCHTLLQADHAYQLLTFFVSTKSDCLDSKHDQFSEWVTLLNCHSHIPAHMPLEHYNPLLYISTAFEILMSPASEITGLENFFDPPSYFLNM
jgi:hypothetical protein